MPIQFKIEITEEGQQTARAIKNLSPDTLAGIVRAMDHENELTVGHIDQVYLSFPKDGPVVPIGCRADTGRLRQSLHRTAPVISGQTVTSSIGSEVVYAAYQEFGFSGTENVRAHTRVTQRVDAAGHDLGPGGKKAARYQRRGAVGITYVKAHERTVDYEGRHFVERGLADRADNYTESISREVMKEKR